ncbi:MAG: alkene reductase [Haliea sp.]|nr:alkene reductase [Haliea sp.]
MASPLLRPVRLGAIELKNPIVMAPMTRARTPSRVPTASMAEYYRQRAGAGLIITEATQISQQGTGTVSTPGIHTPEQIAGWRAVTDAVHAAGGRIVCQIWHCGRVSHTVFQQDGAAPVAPSAVQGSIRTFTKEGFVQTSQPRALALEEIKGVVADFRQAAHNALAAGFDGVEIHGANGYLIDQFLRDGVNQRSDAYGGRIENRCRLLLEVTDAVIDAVGAERTAVRLSPFSTTWDCHDSQPAPLFQHAIAQLDQRGLAFLEIVERINESPISGSAAQVQEGFGTEDVRSVYHGALVLNGGYDRERTESVLAAGGAAAISIARPYMFTPDLAERFASGAPLNPPGDDAAVYGGGDAGYIDFPTLQG